MGIRDFIERARRAQQDHPQQHDVQLEMGNWFTGHNWPWCSETEAQQQFLDATLPVWDYGTEPPTNEERQDRIS